jgi:hypothetical protein
MNTPPIDRYKNYRFPVEIISHAVWLYFRHNASCPPLARSRHTSARGGTGCPPPITVKK